MKRFEKDGGAFVRTATDNKYESVQILTLQHTACVPPHPDTTFCLKQKKSVRGKENFTLIELLVVIAIITILPVQNF